MSMTNAFAGIVGLMALSLAACSQGEVAQPADAGESTANSAVASLSASAPAHAAAVSPRDILDGYLQAWNQHDAEGAGAFLAEDVQYFDAAFAGLQSGRRAAIDQGISVFLRGVPDLRWELRGEPIVGADGIAYEWTFTGTNTGTWGGIRPTNQKINLKGVSLVRIANGKIAYQAFYYDSAALNRQLGY